MGIRYYAYPLAASDVEAARRDPVDYLTHRPLIDDDKPYEEQLRLDLDTSWRELQELFTLPHHSPSEQGMDLVRGSVRYDSGFSYTPHYAVIAPERVVEVAEQISRFDKVDVLTMFLDGARGRLGESGRLREFVSGVARHLADAQRFTAECSVAGYGILYRIG